MSVNAVSQKHDNSVRNGLIAGSVGLVGAGTAGYAAKSILKDGNYTDEFVTSFNNKMFQTKDGKALLAICSLDEKSPTFLDEMVKVIKENAELFEIDPKEITKSDVDMVKLLGGEEQVRNLYSGVIDVLKETVGDELTIGKDTNIVELVKKHVPDDLDEIFDRSKKAFKTDISEDSKEALEYAKKSLRNIKLKAGAVYGGIAAAVLGLGAYIYTKMANK